MTTPTWQPMDATTAARVDLVAEGPLFGDDAEQRFLIACWTDARDNGGRVSVNRVRALLTADGELTIRPQRLSALWRAHTGPGRAMSYDGGIEHIEGDGSKGNVGKPVRTRRWVGDER